MSEIHRLTRSTRRLELRGLEPADRDEFLRVLSTSRDAWGPWIPAPQARIEPGELFDHELRRVARGARRGTHVRLAGFAQGSELIGLFALNEIVRGVFENAHASWQVAAKRQGQGFGTEGVHALLDIAFDPPPEGLGLHRVQANIMPSNAPSLRVAEKVGFRREGVGERYLKIAGRWEDHVMFALTREEWRPVP